MGRSNNTKQVFKENFYDHTLRETAAAVGCSQQGVKVIQQRALRKLAEGLEARGYTLTDVLDSLRSDHDRDDCHIEQEW